MCNIWTISVAWKMDYEYKIVIHLCHILCMGAYGWVWLFYWHWQQWQHNEENTILAIAATSRAIAVFLKDVRSLCGNRLQTLFVCTLLFSNSRLDERIRKQKLLLELSAKLSANWHECPATHIWLLQPLWSSDHLLNLTKSLILLNYILFECNMFNLTLLSDRSIYSSNFPAVMCVCVCNANTSPLTYRADSGRRSSDAGGGDTVLHGAGRAQLGGSSSSRNLWGSWGGVGWLALGCLRLGRQVQWLCTLTVLQKPKQHSFACCDHHRNLEAGGRGWTPSPSFTETTRNCGFDTF